MTEFPGKLILFGEYTILLGGKALAVPIKNFNGKLENEASEVLNPFMEYLIKLNPTYLNVEKIKAEMGKLSFLSNIPIGYGCGSSGALTAAVYDYFSCLNLDLDQQKDSLAEMESFFHEKSSGIDPLVSFSGKPILIDEGNSKTVDFSLNSNMHIYLLNSNLSRNTANLVALFKSKLSEESFQDDVNLIKKLNNSIIDGLLSSTLNWALLRQLSKMQFDVLPFLIPKEIQPVWQNGFDTGDYTMKLCGAGGGGFFLVFSENDKLEITGFELIKAVI